MQVCRRALRLATAMAESHADRAKKNGMAWQWHSMKLNGSGVKLERIMKFVSVAARAPAVRRNPSQTSQSRILSPEAFRAKSIDQV